MARRHAAAASILILLNTLTSLAADRAPAAKMLDFCARHR